MIRIELAAAAAAAAACLLTLASCGSSPVAHRDTDAVAPAIMVPAPAVVTHSATSTDGRSAESATVLIERYFDRLRASDFKGAYRLWGGGGEGAGKTLEAFRADFAGISDLRAEVSAATDQEGAAGSIYITVPVHVTAKRAGGMPIDRHGTFTLRRVNDVEGSTDAQRRWHIQSSDGAF